MCLCIDAWKICVKKKMKLNLWVDHLSQRSDGRRSTSGSVSSPGASVGLVSWKATIYSNLLSSFELFPAPNQALSPRVCRLWVIFGNLINGMFWCVLKNRGKVVFTTWLLCVFWDLLYSSVKGTCINPYTPIASTICLKTLKFWPVKESSRSNIFTPLALSK